MPHPSLSCARNYRPPDINAYWYIVKISDIVGYVWGGLISTFSIIGDFDSDGIKELLLTNCMGQGVQELDEYKAQYYVTNILCKSGVIMSRSPFGSDVSRVGGPPNSYGVYSELGFVPNIDFIRTYSSFGDGPESVSTTKLYYLRGKQFVLLCDYEESQYNDESISQIDSVEVLPPRDTKKPNIMILEKRRVESINGKEKSNKIIERTIIEWKDKIFTKKTISISK
jgi:hypothetical protein